MTTDELNIVITADTGNAASNINNTANALNSLGDSAKTADTDMSDLVRAMSDAAANMVQISSNIAASVSGLTGFQSGLDAVSSSLQGVNIKFDVLNGSIQQSYLAFDGAAASVTNLAASSETSAAALNGIVSATDGFAARMGELQTNTQSTSDGMASLQRELQETLTSIRGFSDNMSNAGKDAEETSRKIRELSDEVQQLAQKSNSGSMGIAGIAAGFKSLKGIVATLGIGKFIKDSNDAYNVQMQNELKLTAHMKQRMNATDEEVQSIKDLASAQQQLGVIGDEIQLAGAQQLTTYARQSSTLKTLLPAMNNLIAQNAGYEASVGDATSAADMLGRALNGQYTSLKRMGVTFTEAQEQVLKYGTESQKASVLAEAITSKVGNMNEMLAQTPTGKIKQLQNDFGDLQEQLGSTFQPLISAVIPVARNMLEILAPPIMNISRGIVTVGQAIASIDSPAVRGIALAAAGVAIVNKLKFALGGTSAGLLLLGVILTGIIGSMQEEQQSIGDIVSDAYNSAANAAGGATDAISDYNDEIANTQKSINRLAGFDTITKLSGGSSSGALVNALLGDNGLDDIYAATNAADDFMSSVSAFDVPKFDFSKVLEGAKGVADDIFKALFGTDEEQYAALNSLNDKVKAIFGEPFTNFWQGVGSDIYNIVNGDDSQIYKGWKDLDTKLGELFGSFYTDHISPYFQQAGTALNSFVNAVQKAASGDYEGASLSIAQSQARLQQLSPVYSEDEKEQLKQLDRAITNKDYKNANILYNETIAKKSQEGLEFVNDIPKNIASWLGDTLQWDTSWYNDFSQGWSNTFEGLGDWVFKAQNQELMDKLSQQTVAPSQTDYRDIPTKSTNNFAAGGLPQINIGVTLDGEQIAAHVVSETDTRANIENGKG